MSKLFFAIEAGRGGCGGAKIEAGYTRELAPLLPGTGFVWTGCVRITVEAATNLPADDAEALGQALISAARVARTA